MVGELGGPVQVERDGRDLHEAKPIPRAILLAGTVLGGVFERAGGRKPQGQVASHEGGDPRAPRLLTGHEQPDLVAFLEEDGARERGRIPRVFPGIDAVRLDANGGVVEDGRYHVVPDGVPGQLVRTAPGSETPVIEWQRRLFYARSGVLERQY